MSSEPCWSLCGRTACFESQLLSAFSTLSGPEVSRLKCSQSRGRSGTLAELAVERERYHNENIKEEIVFLLTAAYTTVLQWPTRLT